MKIAIVGTGYVGLVTGISLALQNHKVICVDNDKNKVSKINKGKSPFFEPDIDKYLKKVLKERTLKATNDLQGAILESNVTIIAVGTPTINSKIDLSFIKTASAQIGESLGKVKNYHVIAVKSTVLPGITEKVIKPILEKYSKKKVGEFGLCMNPEFLREGNAIEDALNPDRIIIGQIDDKSGKEFAKIYSKLSVPKIFTNLATAEFTKYAANSLFATLISFSNEISRIAETTENVDVLDVWKGVHLDKRLSPIINSQRIKPGVLSYILSGCGFGGSCFPKDIKALSSFADEIGSEGGLIKSVIDINTTQPQRMILLLKKAMGAANLKNKKIAVLGLTFKPNTDDIRESVALPIIETLLSQEAIVVAHDPMAYKENISPQLTNLPITLADTLKEALENAEAAIVVTAWDEYIKLSPEFFIKMMKKPIVIDGRRIYDKHSFLKKGVIYKGIGT
ncbi:hypothetical protein A3C59_00535 [Candidatus Daviesbacteria bacterium RIFCSPHIGHO2_02_FULL_36_13]|uniref:UDP-glucose 6-dehydrogenase n=1 Tax=Candidatus Daviesbacteria bacterium RIFCSPHIGHO2_02_FULL_36_13 TaxID=1797768 RepID=A0A1F5JPB9_9BACT|nr:MAG: hypothetical protein A3C59_00535 [Candidatus Daviesbacteria bacterium RIFCSPHIGHO2_02_FULL_36_13]